MKDRLKIGNRITCIIEQAETNFIIVSFRSSGNIYRGVLINENNSTVRRTIPPDFFPTKEVLDQETTVNFCNEIANRELDKSSTTTRSKTSKLSYIILDDYDLPSSNVNVSPIGMSPIDSIRGLVESIDTNKVLSLPNVSSRKNHFSGKLKLGDQFKMKEGNSNNMKNKPNLQSFNGMKKSGFSFMDSNSRVLKSPVKVLNRSSNAQSIFSLFPADQNISVDTTCKRELDPITPPVSASFETSKGTQKSLAKKRKLEDSTISGNDDKETKDGVKTYPSMKVYIPMKNIKKETADKLLSSSTGETILTKECSTENVQKKKKRKRKGLLLQKRKRVTKDKSHVFEDTKMNICIPQQPAATRIIKPRTSKRVDPILIALKNIRKYDSLRKKRNLQNSLPMLDENRPVSLRRKRNTRRNANKSRLTAKVNVMSVTKDLVTEKRCKTTSEACEEDGDKDRVNDTDSKNVKEVNRTNIVDDCQSICFGQTDEKQEVKKKATKTDSEDSSLFEINNCAGVKDTKESSDKNAKTVNDNIRVVNKKLSSPSSIDLICHETGFTINETGAMKETVLVCKPRTKNRRKPIQVFKSLPNPADEKRKKEEMIEKQVGPEEHQTECVSLSRRRGLLQKGHNTRFRGTKSVLPCLNISPRRTRKPRKQIPMQSSHRYMPVEKNSEELFEDKLDSSDGITSSLPSQSMTEADKLALVEKASSCDSNDASDSDVLNSSSERRASDQESISTTDQKEKITKNRRKKKSQLMVFFESLKPLTRCNNEIRLGDVVWGKCKGHGWWPGHVLSFLKFDEDTPMQEREAHVSWMNSNTQSVMTFNDLNLFLPYFRKRFNTSKKGMYCKAVLEAQNMCKLKYGVL